MKTKYVSMDRLIPLLGIALVAAGVAAAATYLDLERKAHSGEAFAATLDRLYQSQRLSAALKTMHDGDANAATQRLDLLLCDNILIINSETASANELSRAYVKDIFVRIARLRPKNPDTATGEAQKLDSDQIQAEKILAQACGEIAQAK